MDIDVFVNALAKTLKEVGTKMPRMIIFCNKYDQCSAMYSLFKYYLESKFTSPPNSPDLIKYWLVDMYTRCTEVKVKNIIKSFCSPEGRLRIVIATIAFEMGLDWVDVRQTIHSGSSSDVESHIQESGRAGRDGFLSCSLVLYGKEDNWNTSQQMIVYCNNCTICQRKLLFEDFEICAYACNGLS